MPEFMTQEAKKGLPLESQPIGVGEKIYQYTFDILPVHDSLKALYGRTDKLIFSKQEVGEREDSSGISTNISQIEMIYPWLLQREGFVNGTMPEWKTTSEINEPSLIGTALHEADALFSVVASGLRGYEVGTYLPNYKTKELARVAHSVGDGSEADWQDINAMQASFIEVWMRYKNYNMPVAPKKLMLPGFGPENSGANPDYLKVPNLDIYVERLAKAWALALVGQNDEMKGVWEFEPGRITQREVMIALHLADPKLTFNAKLDSVTRREPGARVVSQVVDLKTGTHEFTGELEQEIRLRQAQMMLVMAERFTSYYLVDLKQLEPRDYGYYLKTQHDSLAYEDRVNLAAFRLFDKETGDMRIDPVVMDDAQREGFIRWLTWYGRMIHKYKNEIRALKKKPTSYILREISLKRGWDDFEWDGKF